MPNISEIRESKYLTRDDCGTGILVTIGECTQENIALEGNPEDLKWLLHFAEPEAKPMVLKTTNAQLIAQILGSENTEDWVGRKIVLFHDPSVMMRGKLVGGIRVRAPRGQAAKAAAPKTAGVPAPKPRPAPAPEPEPPLTEPEGVDLDVPF